MPPYVLFVSSRSVALCKMDHSRSNELHSSGRNEKNPDELPCDASLCIEISIFAQHFQGFIYCQMIVVREFLYGAFTFSAAGLTEISADDKADTADDRQYHCTDHAEEKQPAPHNSTSYYASNITQHRRKCNVLTILLTNSSLHCTIRRRKESCTAGKVEN